MMNIRKIYLKRITFLTFVGLFCCVLFSAPSWAAGCSSANCDVKWAKCPSGTRTDISADCLKQLNDSYGNCINTMPVDGYVNRVPEDLCLRNRSNPEHNGMDYAANAGTKVTAAADGVVSRANNCASGYGRKIVITHTRQDGSGSTYVSVYAHLSKMLVSQGQIVSYRISWWNNLRWFQKGNSLD